MRKAFFRNSFLLQRNLEKKINQCENTSAKYTEYVGLFFLQTLNERTGIPFFNPQHPISSNKGVGFWLLAHKTRDLSQAEKKITFTI